MANDNAEAQRRLGTGMHWLCFAGSLAEAHPTPGMLPKEFGLA